VDPKDLQGVQPKKGENSSKTRTIFPSETILDALIFGAKAGCIRLHRRFRQKLLPSDFGCWQLLPKGKIFADFRELSNSTI